MFPKDPETFQQKKDDICRKPPVYMVIANGIFSRTKSSSKKSTQFHDLLYNTCGDDDVETTGQYKKILTPA